MQHPPFKECKYQQSKIAEVIARSFAQVAEVVALLHSRLSQVRVVRELQDAVIVAERSTQCTKAGHVSICYGWPFSLSPCSFVEHEDCTLDTEVRIHLRGPWLSEVLKQKFVNDVNADLELNGLSHLEVHGQLGTERKSQNWELGLYVDPFRFSGDSIMHLRNLDAAQFNFCCTRWVKLTVNPSMHTFDDFQYCEKSMLESTISSILADCQSSNCIVVVPVYIDDQWSIARATISGVIKSGVTFEVFLPGRSISISANSSSVPMMFGLSGRDCTLDDSSVEEMIPVAWNLFGFTLPANIAQRCLSSSPNILIHPLTSVPSKNLPSVTFVEALNVLSESFECVCIGGLRNDPNHSAWRDEVESIASREIKWLFPQTIAELKEIIAQSTVVITADSVSAHVAARFDKPAIILYNLDYWDASSALSLRHHSPLGFCYKKRRVAPLACSFSSASHDDLTRLALVTRLIATRLSRQSASANIYSKVECFEIATLDEFWPITMMVNEPLNNCGFKDELELLHPKHQLGF